MMANRPISVLTDTLPYHIDYTNVPSVHSAFLYLLKIHDHPPYHSTLYNICS